MGEEFGTLPDGSVVTEVVIAAGDLSARIINYGAIIRDVRLAGIDHPLVLGFDARGARLAVSAADSVAGRLVPLKALAQEGIDVETYFSEIVETSDPASAITTLFTDEADVAVGWSSLTGDALSGHSFGVLAAMVAERTLAMDEIRIIWQSPVIPFGPHAVRTNLPGDLKALLTEILTEMGGLAPAAVDAIDRRSIGGGGFVPVDPADYAVIEDLMTASD